jgi:hypothetical protein
MPDTITCAAELTVDRPQRTALALFTPEGERAWVPGWAPSYPAPHRTEGAGAVFVTTHAEETTIWVMVEEGKRRLRYARVTAGDTAGTVTVTVVDAAPTRTRLRVEYDLTALGPRGEERLATFRENFASYIGEWEAAIGATSPAGG